MKKTVLYFKFVVLLNFFFCLISISGANKNVSAACTQDSDGGQCVEYVRNYFGGSYELMPGLCQYNPDCGAYNAWEHWDLGFGNGPIPGDNSIMIINQFSGLQTGHMSVVINAISNSNGTYTLNVQESNWDLDELIDCDVTYTFYPDTSEVTREAGTTRYPVLGFIYGQDRCPDIPENLMLARIEGQDPVYWIQNSIKYYVTSPNVLADMSGIPGWDYICDFPPGTLDSFQNGIDGAGTDFIGTSSTSNGLLVERIDDPNVYLMENGQRKWITSAQVFEELGYDWNDVITVSEAIINQIPEGSPIYSGYGNWIKTYTTGQWFSAQSLIKTSDDGFIVVGSFPSNIDINEGAFVLKLDSNGNKDWIKRYGNSNWYGFSHVIETTGNHYIIAGKRTTRYGSNGLIVIINSLGDITWQKEYSGMTGIRFIQKTSDAGYILGGYRASTIPSIRSFVAEKLNSNFEVAWRTEIFLNGYQSEKYPIYETNDGKFIFTPGSYGFGNGPWVIKLDASGNIEWQKNYSPLNTYSSDGRFILPTGDGCFIVCGLLHKTYGVNSSRFFILKIDSNGDALWKKTYDTLYNEWASSAVEMPSGDIFVVGPDYDNQNAPSGKILLIRLDRDGNLLWGKNYGYGMTESFNSGTQPTAPIKLIDNRIYVTGYNKPDLGNNVYQHDLLIMKLNDIGLGGESCDFVSNAIVTADDVDLIVNETNELPDMTIYHSLDTDIPVDTISIGSYPVCQGSALHDQTISQLPFGLVPELTIFDAINLSASLSYGQLYLGIRALHNLLLNWSGSELKLEVFKPDGTLYGEYQDTTPPISIDIPNPEEGLWTYNVTALDIPYDEYQFSLVAGITKYQGDFHSDGEVDGDDLAELIDSGGLQTEVFAENYGSAIP